MLKHAWLVGLTIFTLFIAFALSGDVDILFIEEGCGSAKRLPRLNDSSTFKDMCKNGGLGIHINTDLYTEDSITLDLMLYGLQRENPIALGSLTQNATEGYIFLEDEKVATYPGTDLLAGPNLLCFENAGEGPCMPVVVDYDYRGADFSVDLDGSVPSGFVHEIYEDGGPIMEQIRVSLGVPELRINVTNNGPEALRPTRWNTPHGVAFFLRRKYHGGWDEYCMKDASELEVGDVPIGTVAFSNGIDVHGSFALPSNELNELTLTTNGRPAMCGESDLFVVFDPFYSVNDSDRCNNFIKFDLDIMCNYVDPSPVCDVVEVIGTSGLYAFVVYKGGPADTMDYKTFMHLPLHGSAWVKIDGSSSNQDHRDIAKTNLGRKMIAKRLNNATCELILDDLKDGTLLTTDVSQGESGGIINDADALLDTFANDALNATAQAENLESNATRETTKHFVQGIKTAMDIVHWGPWDNSDWQTSHAAGIAAHASALMADILMNRHSFTSWDIREKAKATSGIVGELKALSKITTQTPRFKNEISRIVPILIEFLEFVFDNADSVAMRYNDMGGMGGSWTTGAPDANEYSDCINLAGVWKTATRAVVSLSKLLYIITADEKTHVTDRMDQCRSKALDWFVQKTGDGYWTKNEQHDDDNMDYEDKCPQAKPQRLNIFWRQNEEGIWNGIYDEEERMMYWRRVATCTCAICPYDNWDSHNHNGPNTWESYNQNGQSWYDSYNQNGQSWYDSYNQNGQSWYDSYN